MVLGCTSGAGKSLLVTALARWFSRQGVDAVPFKAQNMSNNARVVESGEIGVAQWLQARAAGLEPTVDMNPVLIKPEGDTRSQVVVAGVARGDLAEVPWTERGRVLWPEMISGYDRLAAAHDLVLIEGAGSPAEINLPDLVNNRILERVDAAALLVVDIDRGGAFAHLYGTWVLVPETTRRRLGGFVLNRFRGDPSLLEPGPTELTDMTGMPSVGVLPMLAHELPDEEGGTVRATPPAGAPTVAVVRYPYASNLDEFHLLPHAARMRWATHPIDLADADLVILPGSKHVAADARWLRDRALDDAITTHARSGGRVLGVCGGAMLLGSKVADPVGVEGGTSGLGLLPICTEMAPAKLTRRVTVDLPDLPSAWRRLGGLQVPGYEIRHGRVVGDECRLGPMIWARETVFGTTAHGLLEDPDLLFALTGTRPPPVLEDTFELLADAVETHLDRDLLMSLVAARHS